MVRGRIRALVPRRVPLALVAVAGVADTTANVLFVLSLASGLRIAGALRARGHTVVCVDPAAVAAEGVLPREERGAYPSDAKFSSDGAGAEGQLPRPRFKSSTLRVL